MICRVRLHNAIRYDLHCSLNIIRVIKLRRMRLAEHVAVMGVRRHASRVLVGKFEGKRPLGKPRSRCEGNIEMNLQEVGWGSMDWIDLVQDMDKWWAVVNGVMNWGCFVWG
jgi:hypothetical protein